MADSKSGGNFIGQAWLVILLALLYGGGLAAAQTSLGDRIAENKRNETYSVIPTLVPGAVKTQTVEKLVTTTAGKEVRVYKARDEAGTHVGWVIPAGGQGFADRIEVLIGIDAEAGTITGLWVLDQKETPGLGDYITGEGFRSRFVGKDTATPLVVTKSEPRDEAEIRALTGATISSESVCQIVNAAIASLEGRLQDLSGPEPEPTSESTSEPAEDR